MMRGDDAVQYLIERARVHGADAADAIYFDSRSFGVSQRLGKREDVERSESQDTGLRVFVGSQVATVSGSDLRKEPLDALAARAVAMARLAPEDPYALLASAAEVARSWRDLDLADSEALTAARLADMAAEAEDAALAVKGVTNSEGASASTSEARVAIATSNGFAGGYHTTSHTVAASVIAGEGTGMERDYAYSSARHAADLQGSAAIGHEAGTRAVKALNPRKGVTGSVPVVFEPRAAGSLLGHFAGAINGQGVARGTSFLKDSMGERIFAPGITIVDDPHRVRGHKSKPFDGEGLETAPITFIEDGILTSWVLDLASARQLGLASNARAARGTSSPPSPSTSNLYLGAGTISPADLIADIKSGLYVTGLIGMGVNGVTGDYSRGASGFWIENGEIAYAVSEITIAGNLKDMFAHLVPANDLNFKYGTDAPTVRIDGLMIAGA